MDKPITGHSRPVLLADVARIAGVSQTTASMALRSQGVIAKKTRDLVQKVADELHYRPNLAAAMLGRQRDGRVLPGVPVAILGMGSKSHYPFPDHDFVREFSRHATERGFLVSEPEQTAYPEVSKLLRVLYYRGVRGIVLSHGFDLAQFQAEDIKAFSILIHGHPPFDVLFHRVGSRVMESTRFAWQTAWNRGYRRIGAALCQHDSPVADDFAREAAVVNSQIRFAAPRLPSFLGSHYDDAGFIRWVKEVKPDAVIGFSVGHYYLLTSAGFRVPEDIGFISLHRGPPDIEVELTGMQEDYRELGRVTSLQLESMIRHYEVGFAPRPHETLVAFIFHEGSTLPHRQVSTMKSSRKAKRK